MSVCRSWLFLRWFYAKVTLVVNNIHLLNSHYFSIAFARHLFITVWGIMWLTKFATLEACSTS